MSETLSALIAAALLSNLMLSPPLLAQAQRSAQLRTFGPAAAALITLACPLAWLLNTQLLQAFDLSHLTFFVFIPCIAALAWLTLHLLTKLQANTQPLTLWALLFLNAAGLGSLLQANPLEDFAVSLYRGLGAGLLFWLALLLCNDLFKRLQHCDVPAPFRGLPVQLISAGLMGIACLGLNGLLPV